VECGDSEVRKLYWLLSLFFAKCDGSLSNAEVQRLKGDSGSIPFDPYQTPPERKDSILIRLKFLKKYNINNAQEIIRVLTWGLFVTERFDPSDRKYLIEFVENPEKPFSMIAKRLTVSTSSVLDAYHRLNRRIQFRFISALNFPLFKLKHIALFFKPNEEFHSAMLNRPFTLAINRDTFGEWMWATFLVPNQSRSILEFNEGLKKLAHEAFIDYRSYEIKSVGRACNLALFDGEKWIHSEDILGIGPLKLAESNKGALPPLYEFSYGEDSIEFDKIDFLISCMMYGNARIKNSEIRKALDQYGHRMSWVTLSKRITSLKKAGAFRPYFNFSGLGLNVAIVFAVECQPELLETLYFAFPQFPECTAHRTDKGVIFMIRTAAESAPAVSYLVQSSLQNEADRLIVANRLENIGSKIPITLYEYWNSDKQYWEFERGSFDLTKKKS
jgi:DNA-binding Lrp family transcriptional regulator